LRRAPHCAHPQTHHQPAGDDRAVEEGTDSGEQCRDGQEIAIVLEDVLEYRTKTTAQQHSNTDEV
jgi:hypothetical protein